MCPPGGVSKSRGGWFVDLTFPAFPLTPSPNGRFSLHRRGLFVSWGSFWERDKESARDTMGIRTKRAKRPPAFSLFPSSPARFLFSHYCYFYWDTQRDPLRRRKPVVQNPFPQTKKRQISEDIAVLFSILCWSHYLVLLPIIKMLL